MLRKNQQHGFSILEVVVGLAIISLSLFSLISVIKFSLRLNNNNTKDIQAGFLLEEGMEAVKMLRDSSWSGKINNLIIASDYYLSFNSTTNVWEATSTNIYLDNFFERKFVLSNVYRNSNDDIVSSGGTLDPNTKKVTVYVSWFSGTGTTTKSISTYITNIFNN